MALFLITESVTVSTLWLNWGIASFSVVIQNCSFTYCSFAYYHIIIRMVFNLFKLLSIVSPQQSPYNQPITSCNILTEGE